MNALTTSAVSIKDIHLLLVDDDVDDLEIIQATFSRLSWSDHAHLLSSGEDLLALLEAAEAVLPSVIVLDCSMPRLGAEALLVIIKNDSRFQKIPVVVYSTLM